MARERCRPLRPSCSVIVERPTSRDNSLSGMEASLAKGRWPVVGREAEFAAVTSFLRAPLESSAALVIEGEAGIGKSTIVRGALERASAAGLIVLAARLSASESALPYAALGDLLAAVDDDALSALARPQRDAIAVALDKANGTVHSHALSRGLLELIRASSAAGNLLLAFDDVQWLDRPTASAVAFALRRLADSRLRVLFALRTRGRGARRAPWRGRLGELSPARHRADVRNGTRSSARRASRRAATASPPGGDSSSLGRQPDVRTRARPARSRGVAGRHDALRRGVDATADARRRCAHRRIGRRVGAAAFGGSAAARRSRSGGAPAALASGILEVEGERLSFAHPLLGAAADELLLPDERRQIHARLAAASLDAVERGHHLSRSAGIRTRPRRRRWTLRPRRRQASVTMPPQPSSSSGLRSSPSTRSGTGQQREVRAAAEFQLAGDVEAAATSRPESRRAAPTGVARARARCDSRVCTGRFGQVV